MLKQTRLIMGMPITVEVLDAAVTEDLFEQVFAYFQHIDEKFSTYKEHSEISRLNRQEISLEQASEEMKTVFALAEEIRHNTNGYFDIRRDPPKRLRGKNRGKVDPSGLVKGWAIWNASEMIRKQGFENYYVEAGGDIQAVGKSDLGQNWRVGIRNPFNMDQIVRVLGISDRGVATSGTSIRGQHIYNPFDPGAEITDIVSLTVIGPDIYESDCYATAAFAMGRAGITFIESLGGFEGYSIDKDRQATYTSGFMRYVIHDTGH